MTGTIGTTTQPVRAGTLGDGEDFIRFFAHGLAMGNVDDFLEYFLPHVHPDGRWRQPLSREGYGPEGVRRLLTSLFTAIPDLRGEVHRWGRTADGVLVEFTFSGTLGGRSVVLPITDRIVLRDGYMLSNDTYFDPLPLVPRMVVHPVVAVRLLRDRYIRTEDRR